jgi:hypothetical protein
VVSDQWLVVAGVNQTAIDPGLLPFSIDEDDFRLRSLVAQTCFPRSAAFAYGPPQMPQSFQRRETLRYPSVIRR